MNFFDANILNYKSNQKVYIYSSYTDQVMERSMILFFVINLILNVLPGSCQEDLNSILWINNMDGSVRLGKCFQLSLYSCFLTSLLLVDLQDPLKPVCNLPGYPGYNTDWPAGPAGPSVLAYISGELVSCGSYNMPDDRNCSSFSISGATWEALPPLEVSHCPWSWRSKSFAMDGGVWVGGQEGVSCSTNRMISEILDVESMEWKVLPVQNPFDDFYPNQACIVPLDESTLFISGGEYKFEYYADNWLFDIHTSEWTPLTPLPAARYDHGCAMTQDGNVIVIGGYPETSVLIFDPSTMTWTKGEEIPEQIQAGAFPTVLAWKDSHLFLERNSENIWLREPTGEWQLLDVNMGSRYLADGDPALIVSDDFWQLC